MPARARRWRRSRPGTPRGRPALSPDGTRLYVCNRFDHNVSVIDLPAAREITRVAAVREPVAAAVTPDGRTVLGRQPSAEHADGFGVYRRRGGRRHDLRCPDLCHRRDRTARRLQRPARALHDARRNLRLGDAPAVQLPDGPVPRGHGLDQRERGQHHRRAATKAGGHDRAGRILLGRRQSVGRGLYRRRQMGLRHSSRHARIERHRPRGPAEQGRTAGRCRR